MKKAIKIIASTFLLMLSLGVFAFAQNSETKCPNIEIVGQRTSVKPGETMVFSVTFNREAKTFDFKYFWQVDKGIITRGQQREQITVATEGLSGETIKASLEIEGLPKRCRSKFSETGIVVGLPTICGIDEFGDLIDDDVRARIDAFFIELQNNPKTLGYIVNYGQPKDVLKREALIREHIKFRKYDGSRIVIQYKDEEQNKDEEQTIRTRLWVVPEGADLARID